MHVQTHGHDPFGRRFAVGRLGARRACGPAATIVAISGDVDEPAAADFADAIDAGIDLAVQTLVVDMSGVGFLGIAGAQTLAVAAMHANCNGVEMLLVPGGRAVTRPLTVTGVLDRFRCFPSVRVAVEEREAELAAHTGLDVVVEGRGMAAADE